MEWRELGLLTRSRARIAMGRLLWGDALVCYSRGLVYGRYHEVLNVILLKRWRVVT
jgi:hypothetical protein